MNLLFFSSHHGIGASESLWLETAAYLARAGHQVSAMAAWARPWRDRSSELRRLGVSFEAVCQPSTSPRVNRVLNRMGWAQRRFRSRLRQGGIDAAYFSQGNDITALPWLETALNHRLPSTLVTHGVIPSEWPNDATAARLRTALTAAKKTFWVSQGNRRDMEFHIGTELPNAAHVWNPIRWNRDLILPWPTSSGAEFRLACVARMQARPKGHDLLLQALAGDPWTSRNWRLSFYGDGPNVDGMRRLASHLGLSDRVRFMGHVADLTAVWKDEHWIAQPSRNEGMPMSLIEALMAGRPAIATDLAGHGEVLLDEETGVLSPSASVPHLREALNRAWDLREQAAAMGTAAASHIRALTPTDPVTSHANDLIDALTRPAAA